MEERGTFLVHYSHPESEIVVSSSLLFWLLTCIQEFQRNIQVKLDEQEAEIHELKRKKRE